MTVNQMKIELERLANITNEEWLSSLSERKRKELEFHDLERSRDRKEVMLSTDQKTYKKFYGNYKYYEGNTLSNRYIDGWIIENSKGKIFLDYACGDGRNTIKSAKAGAALSIGIDISRVSIENARIDAMHAGVASSTYFVQADAEDTRLPPFSVDRVICCGMLHHLDLSYAFPELRRVLIPGGKILAVESLAYNPLIKLYRFLTPQMRTVWEKEHILTLRDLRFAQKFFDVREVRYWHITSILYPVMKKMLSFFNLVDIFLTKLPLIKLMSWIITFELVKPDRGVVE